jgi:hypothetical protein
VSAARERVDSGIFSTAKNAAANDSARASPVPAAPVPPPSERELVDFPAAVVCAVCGDAECVGCENEPTGSGIVAIVPWERQGLALVDRLWTTSRATTRDAEGFFALLPDGPLGQALAFALLAETIAVLSFAACAATLICALAWPWLHAQLSDPLFATLLFRAAVLGVPSVVVVLLVAHVVHGLFIDVGARRAGAKSARRRAIRFGLYAVGWDLVLSPAGALLALGKDGFRAFPKLVASRRDVPARSSSAFLLGTYRIAGSAQKAPLFIATLGAVIATIVGAGIIFALVAVYMLA